MASASTVWLAGIAAAVAAVVSAARNRLPSGADPSRLPDGDLLDIARLDLLDAAPQLADRIGGDDLDVLVAQADLADADPLLEGAALEEETIEDLVILRDAIEHATDYIRNEWVDGKRIQLPFDRELLSEWQGHNYVVIKSSGNAYGKRKYSEGTFHTLDAGRMVACVRSLPQIKALLDKPQQEDVLDIFPGAASGASRGSSESTSRPVTDIYQDFGML